ncbi:unnamed protein product [Rhizophagus irregularis]|uniref:MATA-HMG n=4 Tax=Rhizophagus irregularis TaxID=588596 RepID=A0A1B1EUX0_9GLOM|nr:MATA-HMG [Rhizophagus irregularis]CAB4430912.1 unnamed protein product [Rhizophagus irregularis]CAB4431111.1 unnamed protein product [Rhizophagus irregularis]
MPRSPSSKKTSLSNLPEDMPKITMPFPPKMTAEEFLRSRPLSRAYFRSPNSFFIYRQQFVKQLKLENYNDQMVKVSKWAGIFWSNEPSNVKEHYKNIEKEIQKLLNEQFKNEQNNPYNIIPRFIFEYQTNVDDNDNNNNNNNENPLTNVTDVGNVADVSSDWSRLTEFDSQTIPVYDELPTDFYFPFTPISSLPFTSPVSFASPVPSVSPILSASPVSPLSPVFPSYSFNYYDVNENGWCNNYFESCMAKFDELDELRDFDVSINLHGDI